jgi:hypothetical protein
LSDLERRVRHRVLVRNLAKSVTAPASSVKKLGRFLSETARHLSYRHRKQKASPKQATSVLQEKTAELLEVGCGDIGHGDIGETSLLPRESVIARAFTRIASAHCRRVWQHKHVDDVFSPAVHKRGSSPSREHIETAAEQREPFVGEIVHGRSEIDFAVKPGFHCVLIRGWNIGEMTRLKRTQVSIDCGNR